MSAEVSGIFLIQFVNIFEDVQEILVDRILLTRICTQTILVNREGIRFVIEVAVTAIAIHSFELIRQHVKSHA